MIPVHAEAARSISSVVEEDNRMMEKPLIIETAFQKLKKEVIPWLLSTI